MILKFTDLPPRAKLFILKNLPKEDVKKIATLSVECSILAHMTLTKFWINSDKAKTWINLPYTSNDLEFKTFTKPNPVLRVDRRHPQILNGFKRRSIRPQFLPMNCLTMEEYDKRISKGADVDPLQAPWGTMVCTWNFSDYSEETFNQANEWEPFIPEANELKGESDEQDESSDSWIYFAIAFEGVVNDNGFKERSLLGIPRSDIVGAITQSYDPKKTKYWLNPNFALMDHHPDIYNRLADFILKKASVSVQSHLTLPRIKHKRPITLITPRKEEPTPRTVNANDPSDEQMLNSTLEGNTQQDDLAANYGKKRKMSELLSLFSEFTQKGGNRLCALITEELLHEELMSSYGNYEETLPEEPMANYGN